MPGKYINPYTDFGFKRIFGQEANKDVLISFLNSILPERHHVADLQFRNTALIPPREGMYWPILDLYCESPSGERFIVEMQQKNPLLFMDRTVYYTACAIREQFERGYGPQKLAAVYFIGIMDFVYRIENSEPELLKEISLKDEHGVEMYDRLRIYFLQMPLFDKDELELTTPFDKWLFFLKNLPSLDHIPAILGEPVFKKAFETAERAKMTASEEWDYIRALDAVAISKLMFENERIEGRAEGRAEGRTEGRAEGMATIIRSMMKTMSISDVAKITGIDKTEIEALTKEI